MKPNMPEQSMHISTTENDFLKYNLLYGKAIPARKHLKYLKELAGVKILLYSTMAAILSCRM